MTPTEIAFFSALVASISGMITLIAKAIIKSNCLHCKCWGAECTREPMTKKRF